MTDPTPARGSQIGASLSTHVLDTAHGCPAAGLAVTLTDASGSVLFEHATDADGRCPRYAGLAAGRYRIAFALGDYFRARGVRLSEPPFLDVVSVDFGVADNGHYHVPLLASPFAYSTYRGS